jgi:hypothetical protein
MKYSLELIENHIIGLFLDNYQSHKEYMVIIRTQEEFPQLSREKVSKILNHMVEQGKFVRVESGKIQPNLKPHNILISWGLTRLRMKLQKVGRGRKSRKKDIQRIIQGKGSQLAICEHCETLFYRTPNKLRKAEHHFCSRDCHHAWRRKGGESN